MRLKDISINTKLLLSFGVILALLVSLALTSWYRLGSRSTHLDDARYAMTLNAQILDLGMAHQRFMSDAGMFFIKDDMKNMAVEPDSHRCNLGQWLFGEGRKEAEAKLPQLTQFFQELQTQDAAFHQAIQEINTQAQGQDRDTVLAEARKVFERSAEPAMTRIGKTLADISNTLTSYADTSTQSLQNSAQSGRRYIVIFAAVSLLAGLVFSMLTSRSISRTIRQLAFFTDSLAKGNMRTIATIDRKDEMGQLACSANTLAASLNSMCARVHGSSSTINVSADSLNRLSMSLFDSAQEMSTNCNAVAVAAEEMNTDMAAIASATAQTSNNVNMVAAATEEMTATITEIASGSENARVITEKAVTEAAMASERVKELGEAAEKINKVTETINEIADQTNLLALNATIEAARAGEAGKGFAVVANEIKDLAKQTTAATREIQERIEGVQVSSGQTISVINTISEIITNTSEIVSTMAAAVEQQAVTSKEIANNINQASVGMQEVTDNIAQASEVNSEVARDIALLKVEAEKVAAGSSDVKELGIEMKYNAQALANVLENFQFKQAKFDIGRIKDAHFNWKMRLTSVLAGYTSMNAKDIPNHHQCDFGKWYDNAPEELSSLPLFKEIGTYHEEVHRKAMEAVDLYNTNNATNARRKVEEFETARRRLFKRLDQLYLS